MEFYCSICNYSSDVKKNVIRHLSRKIKCGNDNDLYELVSKCVDYNCDYCKKSFSLKKNLVRHLNICKTKKSNLEEENKKLKEELLVAKALAQKPSTINNTQININLAPWNDPKLPNDVEKYYREAIKKIFLAVPTLIKYIHFNNEHTENHNISIKNGRNKTAKVYNGKEWETIDEDILIRTLIDDYEHTLEYYAEENNPKYLEKIQEIKDRDTEEKVYDDLHIEVKRVIYDRNHMIKIKN